MGWLELGSRLHHWEGKNCTDSKEVEKVVKLSSAFKNYALNIQLAEI